VASREESLRLVGIVCVGRKSLRRNPARSPKFD
jgi:hypothetical protein